MPVVATKSIEYPTELALWLDRDGAPTADQLADEIDITREYLLKLAAGQHKPSRKLIERIEAATRKLSKAPPVKILSWFGV